MNIKKQLRYVLVLVTCVGSTPVLTADVDAPSWAERSLRDFEAYCFQTEARYEQIAKIAAALELRPIPEKYDAFFMGAGSTEGQGFFSQWDKDANVYVLLGFSKPDGCAIHVQGVSPRAVVDQLLENYKLVRAFKDDVGMQITEGFVPAGTAGNKAELAINGLITFTYTKPATEASGYTIAYMPPRTAQKIF